MLVVAVVVLASLLAYDFLKAAVVQRKRERQYDKDQAYRNMLSITLLRVEDLTSIPCAGIGVHVYEIRTRLTPIREIRRDGPLRQELSRAHRYRVSTLPTPCDIRWTKAKGVVGRAWANRAFEVVDMATFDASVRTLNQPDWDSRSAESRLGLSFAEFVKISGRYDAVAAAPIVSNEGKVLGCVSLDVKFDGGFSLLSKDAIRRELADAAQTALGIATS